MEPVDLMELAWATMLMRDLQKQVTPGSGRDLRRRIADAEARVDELVMRATLPLPPAEPEPTNTEGV